MLEADAHDLSDDPDYAASQLQGLGDSMHPDGASSGASETVYLKENVAIHPTQFASERISGRLRLARVGSDLFMSWIPYKQNPSGGEASWRGSNSELLEKDRILYTIRDLQLTNVHSIRRHAPALGWQYIIVVLSSGLAYPPLYFYNGGVREFLTTLKKYISIVRAADDANVFLVNDFKDPFQKTLSSLELPRMVTTAHLASSSNTLLSSAESSERLSTTLDDLYSSASQYRLKPRLKPQDPAHDLSMQVLEKFSLVTKFARDTTAHLFGDGHSNGFKNDMHERRQQIAAATVIQPKSESNEVKTNENEHPLVSDSLEIDKLSLVWGKPREQPLGFDEWATFLDFEGRIMDPHVLKRQVFYSGVKSGLRKEAWKFLLGYYCYESTYAEREYLSSIKRKEYETIKLQWKSISPVQAKKFMKFRERKGLIEKDVVRTDRSLSFFDGDENPNIVLLHDVLMTYSFYNFDLGYCQGMSDFLSPILFVMEDESEAFWCFVALMERLGPNFNRDQSGMHSQLFALSKLVEILDLPLHNYFKQKDCLNYFFYFRWILIQFKREFEYEQVMRLWEIIWTHHLSEHLHLYLCVAILKQHRRKIMDEEMDFDTLLKFINELSGHIDLDRTIRDAEALCVCAGENGAACIPPGTPPSLPIESDILYNLQDDDDFGKTGCI